MKATVVGRGCYRTIEKFKAYLGVEPSGVEARYRVRRCDNDRNSIVVHTPFLSMEYVFGHHRILRGAMVFYIK